MVLLPCFLRYGGASRTQVRVDGRTLSPESRREIDELPNFQMCGTQASAQGIPSLWDHLWYQICYAVEATFADLACNTNTSNTLRVSLLTYYSWKPCCSSFVYPLDVFTRELRIWKIHNLTVNWWQREDQIVHQISSFSFSFHHYHFAVSNIIHLT